MKKYVLIMSMLSSVFSNAQFFKDAFDRQYLTTDSSRLGLSLYSGRSMKNPGFDIEIGNGQGTYQTATGPIMHALLDMYRGTNDTSYLNQFIINSKIVQDHRDDRMQGKNHGDPFPSISESYTNTSIWVPDSSPPRPVAPTWSIYRWYGGEHVWYASAVYTGQIIWPMSEFIHLVRKDQPFLAAYYCPLIEFETMGEYADWLEKELKNTIEAHTDENFDYRNGIYRRDVFIEKEIGSFIKKPVFGCYGGVHSFLAPHNFATAMGRPFAILYDCTSDSGFKSKLGFLLTKLKENWCNYTGLEVNGEGVKWFHKQVKPGDKSLYEEISHGGFAVEMALLCYQYGIRDSKDNTFLYNETFIRRLVNTFLINMFKGPHDISAGVNGDSKACQGCERTDPVKLRSFINSQLRGVYAWLPLCRTTLNFETGKDLIDRDIYHIIADYYLDRVYEKPEGWPLTGSIPTALAAIVYYQSLTEEILDPVSILRSHNADIKWSEVATGDIDNDGIDEFVAVRKDSTGPALVVYELERNSSHPYLSRTKMLAEYRAPDNSDFTALTVGDFDYSFPGDEIITISKVNKNPEIYHLEQGELLHYSVKVKRNKAMINNDISVGDFIKVNGHEELIIIDAESQWQLIQFNPKSNLLTVEMTGNVNHDHSRWEGMASGDLDGDGFQDDFVAFENTDGFVYAVIYDDEIGKFVTGPIYKPEYKTEWRSVACGDVRRGQSVKDEVLLVDKTTGDLQVFTINDKQWKLTETSYFTSDLEIDAIAIGKLTSSEKYNLILLRNLNGDALVFDLFDGIKN